LAAPPASTTPTTPPAGSPVSPSPSSAPPQVASDVAPFAFSVPTYPRHTATASSPSSTSWGPAIPSPTNNATASSSQQPNPSIASPNNSSVGNSAGTAPIGVVKTTTQNVASLEKVKADLSAIEPADDGVKWCLDTEELCLPVQKPGHWSIGETMSTTLVAIRFFVCVKLTITTPTNPGSVSSLSSSTSSSNSHSTEVALPPHEIQVVPISAARRAYVLAKIEQTKATRAASKSASTSATKSPSGHLAPPSASASSSGRPTRRLRSTRDTARSPLASSSEREHQKKKSKKRLRGEREKDNNGALPSPPPSPYEFHLQLPEASSSTSSTVPLLRGHQPTRLVIPSSREEEDEDVKMDSPSRGSEESSDDGFFVMSGDLSIHRMSKRLPKPSHASSPASSSSPRHQHNLRSGPRSPTLPSSPRAGSSSKSKSSRDASGSKSKSPFKSFVSFASTNATARRPMTADGRRSAERDMDMSQGYQRATSVGAVSPTNVLLLTERMGELMDLEEEDDRREDEDNPFSFSPPPPDMLPGLPDIQIQSPSLESPTGSPASTASTVTIRQSPVPASTSAERANLAMALLEREWEEEFSRRGSANLMAVEEIGSEREFAGQCRKRRTRTRELAAAEE
ncbi:hypothetical protein FRC01_010589, partial [Tulasnella sp. 417]